MHTKRERDNIYEIILDLIRDKSRPYYLSYQHISDQELLLLLQLMREEVLNEFLGQFIRELCIKSKKHKIDFNKLPKQFKKQLTLHIHHYFLSQISEKPYGFIPINSAEYSSKGESKKTFDNSETSDSHFKISESKPQHFIFPKVKKKKFKTEHAHTHVPPKSAYLSTPIANTAPTEQKASVRAQADDSLKRTYFEAGPRGKNFETRVLESIVKGIINGDKPEIEIDDQLNEVSLIYQEDVEHPINLTALFHSANLSHVEFTDEEVDNYVRFLEQNYSGYLDNLDSTTLPSHFQQLRKGYLYAFAIYTNSFHLNDLANGKFTAEYLRKFSYQIFFMLTSLAIANQAQRELCVVASRENITDTQPGIPLYRRDNLEWREYHEGPILFESDGPTSTTHIKDTITLVEIHDAPAFAPSLKAVSSYPSENEVLIGSDAQVVYIDQHRGMHRARLINSPIEREMSYLAAIAVRFAFKHRLSLDYDLGGWSMSRFDHGLEHTLRKVFYVTPLIDYLSRYSTNPRLVNFCKDLTRDLSQFIKLIMVFSVTGRESDISFMQNPDLYRKYKKDSAMWFGKFADYARLDHTCKQRGMRLVEYLGHPDFITVINTPNKPDYCEADNFIYLITSMAHDLDLVRHLNRQDFDKTMEKHHSTAAIVQSEKQNTEYNAILEYAVECIIVTGDTAAPGYPQKKADQSLSNPNRFRFSKNPLACEKALEQVPTPKFKDALQPRQSYFWPAQKAPAQVTAEEATLKQLELILDGRIILRSDSPPAPSENRRYP